MSMLKVALGLVASAYVNESVVKPRSQGRLARAYCDRVGKPLLFVRGERVVDFLVGDPVKAEVTTRVAYPLPYRDKQFGAVFAVNVLEALRRPDLALREWRRVADKVVVVVPSWWSPQAWLDPSNRWLVHPDLSRIAPLWTSERSIYLLPVSDRRYGGQRWSPTKTTSTSPSPSPRRREESPSQSPSHEPSLPPSPSETSPPNPSDFVSEPDSGGSLYEDTLPVLSPDLSDLPTSALGNPPSSSFNSPRALTVVSTPEFDDD